MPAASSVLMALKRPEPFEGETLVPELASSVVAVIAKVSVGAAASESEICKPETVVVPLLF